MMAVVHARPTAGLPRHDFSPRAPMARGACCMAQGPVQAEAAQCLATCAPAAECTLLASAAAVAQIAVAAARQDG